MQHISEQQALRNLAITRVQWKRKNYLPEHREEQFEMACRQRGVKAAIAAKQRGKKK